MKCLICRKISLNLICVPCQKTHLVPNIIRRELACGLEVFSFFKFSEIEFLLKSKYDRFGSGILKILAQNSFAPFSKSFEFEDSIYALSIDDDIKKGYSHSAILARSLKSGVFRPRYSCLLAKSHVKYAGKDLDFRLKNPKGFEYTGKQDIDTILVDDIITTGTTLCEAKKAVEMSGSKVLFALTLADAKE